MGNDPFGAERCRWSPKMIGYDTADGYRVEPLDNRDEAEPGYEVNPILSCSNTDFGGETYEERVKA
jgi:hypothetical protein